MILCFYNVSSRTLVLIERRYLKHYSSQGKIRGLLPYQPVYSKEMVERIDKIDKIVRSNRQSLSFQPLDCYCNYQVRTSPHFLIYSTTFYYTLHYKYSLLITHYSSHIDITHYTLHAYFIISLSRIICSSPGLNC